MCMMPYINALERATRFNRAHLSSTVTIKLKKIEKQDCTKLIKIAHAVI